MTTAATSLLGLALPVTGELSGTWGDVVNTSITALIDSAIAGTTTLSTDADVTLTTTTLAANQAREAIILWTGNGTATRTITAPAQSKVYIVINKTYSTQSIKLVGSGPTTGVTIVAGETCVAAWNGLDFVKISSTVAGVVPPASGGTGVVNSGTITLGGNLATSGAYSLTFTTTAGTNVTLPTTGTLATLAGSETLTNKTISGASNTLSNIANASLTNSSVTVNGSSVSLGGSITITAVNPNALTIGTGLSGTSYSGSGAVTIAIDSTVATLTGSQTLTNKTLTSPVIGAIVNTGTLTLPTTTDTLVGRATTDTLTNKTLTGFTETVVAVSGTTPALTPTTGTIQTWALSGSSTPTAGTWAAGQSMTLMVSASSYTITWTSLAVTWVGGGAPTLSTSLYTVIELWKVGSTIYGALVGNA